MYLSLLPWLTFSAWKRLPQTTSPLKFVGYRSPLTLQYGTDFKVFPASPTEKLAAPVTTVPNVGCDAGDYANFPKGHIALVMRG